MKKKKKDFVCRKNGASLKLFPYKASILTCQDRRPRSSFKKAIHYFPTLKDLKKTTIL
jgi:hypothetical protein